MYAYIQSAENSETRFQGCFYQRILPEINVSTILNACLFYNTIHVAFNQEMLNKTHISKGLRVYVIELF